MKRHLSQISKRYLLPGVVTATMASASLLAACGEDTAGHNGSWQQHGQLLAWDREVWIVDAVPIVVPERLDVDGERVLGSRVEASGSYDDEGRMIAETVSISLGSLPDSTLEQANHVGTITSVSDSIWVVGETAILVPDDLAVSGIEGVDAAMLASGDYTATVTGYRYGEGTIVASAIGIAPANGQDGNNAPLRTPVVAEPSDDADAAEEPEEVPTEPPANIPAEAPTEKPAEPPVREPERPSTPADDDDDDENRGQDQRQNNEEKKSDKDKKDKKDD